MNTDNPIKKTNCNSEIIEIAIPVDYTPINFIIFGPDSSSAGEKNNNLSSDHFGNDNKSYFHSEEIENLINNIIGKKTQMEGIWEQAQKDHLSRKKDNYLTARLKKLSFLKFVNKIFPLPEKFLDEEKEWWIDNSTISIRSEEKLTHQMDKQTGKKHQFNLKEKLFSGLIEVGFIRKRKKLNNNTWNEKPSFLDHADGVVL